MLGGAYQRKQAVPRKASGYNRCICTIHPTARVYPCAHIYIQEEVPAGQVDPTEAAVGLDGTMEAAVDAGAFAGIRGGNYSLQLSLTQPPLEDDRQAILACTHARGYAQELAVTTASFESGCARRLCVQDARES